MASVRKRKLPSGEIRFIVDYRDTKDKTRDKNGKRTGGKRHWKQFKTQREAKEYETKVRGEIVAGIHVPDSRSVTVKEASDYWLERAETERLEAATARQYRQHVQHHILPELGTLKLCELTKPAVEAFRDRLLKSRSRPLTRAVLTSLKGILKEAQRRGLVGQNVAADTEVKLSKRGKAKVEIPTKDEIRGLVNKAVELWPTTRVQTTRQKEQKVIAVAWHPLIVTALFTGLRCSELRGLRWECVDFDENVIRVRTRADFRNVLGDPKSAAGRRDIPMAPMVINTLKRWKLACPKKTRDLVFPTHTGNIVSNSNLHKFVWRPLLRALDLVTISTDRRGKKVEVPKYTFHHLRHAAASLFIESGWSPKKIQSVMGHSSITVTYDVYGHLFRTAEDDVKIMEQIEKRLFG